MYCPRGWHFANLQAGRAVVYQTEGSLLRNVTARYTSVAEALWKPEIPRFINLGDSVFADYIGAGWDECDAGYPDAPPRGHDQARRAAQSGRVFVYRRVSHDGFCVSQCAPAACSYRRR